MLAMIGGYAATCAAWTISIALIACVAIIVAMVVGTIIDNCINH